MKCNVCGSEIDGIVGLCPYCFSNLYTDAEQLENDLIYKSNIETMLMSLDAAQISRCAYAANDSYNQALEKLKTLHNISQQGSAYNNYLFSEDPNAKMFSKKKRC